MFPQDPLCPAVEGRCASPQVSQQHPTGKHLLAPLQQQRQDSPPRATLTPRPHGPTPGHTGGPSVPETPLGLRVLAGPWRGSPEAAAFRVMVNQQCFFQAPFFFFLLNRHYFMPKAGADRSSMKSFNAKTAGKQPTPDFQVGEKSHSLNFFMV